MRDIRASVKGGTLAEFTQHLRSVFSPPIQALMP